MTILKFTKMHGLGNDFVIFDQRSDGYSFTKDEVVKIADRNTGIGCDQIILIKALTDYDGELIEFYNSSGEEVMACGNGSRCVANLLMKEKNVNEITIKTKERSLNCQRVSDDIVSIDMGKPKFDWKEIPLKEDPSEKQIVFTLGSESLDNPFFVNVGNPHIVFFVNNIDKFDILKFGPEIENHDLFPEKINVSIANVVSKNEISLNVWERGAGYTLACGTGACATAVAAIKGLNLQNQLKVSLPGGTLDIHYKLDSNIIMSGETEISFEGSFEL